MIRYCVRLGRPTFAATLVASDLCLPSLPKSGYPIPPFRAVHALNMLDDVFYENHHLPDSYTAT